MAWHLRVQLSRSTHRRLRGCAPLSRRRRRRSAARKQAAALRRMRQFSSNLGNDPRSKIGFCVVLYDYTRLAVLDAHAATMGKSNLMLNWNEYRGQLTAGTKKVGQLSSDPERGHVELSSTGQAGCPHQRHDVPRWSGIK